MLSINRSIGEVKSNNVAQLVVRNGSFQITSKSSETKLFSNTF